MLKVISIMTSVRIIPLVSTNPMDIVSSVPESYQNYDLNDVMNSVANLNAQFLNYPGMLRSRSISIVDSWLILDEGVKESFLDNDKTDSQPNIRRKRAFGQNYRPAEHHF